MFVFNPDQEDHDQDDKGDVCDRDIDGDGQFVSMKCFESESVACLLCCFFFQVC